MKSNRSTDKKLGGIAALTLFTFIPFASACICAYYAMDFVGFIGRLIIGM